MLVTINFPPNGAINTLIAEKYARFYKNRAKRIRSPRAILRTQLSSEAMTVASFHWQQVTYETDVRGASYNPWKAHKWLVTKYRHWYFAGVIKKTRKGDMFSQCKRLPPILYTNPIGYSFFIRENFNPSKKK